VWATTTAAVGTRRVVYGETWWADDPIVKANPSLFTDDPRKAGLQASMPIPEEDRIDRYPVEQVTAGPGEKRSAVKRG